MRSVHAICALTLLLGCQVILADHPPRNPALPAPPPPRIDHRSHLPPVVFANVVLRVRQDDGFRPVSELPPEEKMPAAPMLVGAYVFVVVALFVYLLSLSRRLGAVAKEIVRLESQVKRGERS